MKHLWELHRQDRMNRMDYIRRGLITSGELKRLV